MSEGFASCHADTIEDDFIQEVCPVEFQAFNDTIEDEDTSLDDVARHTRWEPIEEVPEKVVKAYKALRSAFRKATGLTLFLTSHDQNEEGDRYDDVNGYFWCVGGVSKRTPAGTKYKDRITEKSWVDRG